MNRIFLLPLLFHLAITVPSAPPANTASSTIATYTGNAGYFIISVNPQQPGLALVSYYNSKDELIRKEWHHADQMDINNNRVLRSLKKSLREALALHTGEW